MTLKELAENLRTVAYELDGAHRTWNANDEHVANLTATVARLTTRARLSDEQWAAERVKLARAEAKLRIARRRKAAKRGRK